MSAVLSQTHATTKAAPFILLLIIFIDGLGTALLLPMLPMLLDPADPAGVVFASAPTAVRTAWLYGVLLAGYAFAMMLGAPLLGALSDRIGGRISRRICPEHLGGEPGQRGVADCRTVAGRRLRR